MQRLRALGARLVGWAESEAVVLVSAVPPDVPGFPQQPAGETGSVSTANRFPTPWRSDVRRFMGADTCPCALERSPLPAIDFNLGRRIYVLFKQKCVQGERSY